jgi:hypothetical protein
MERITMKNLNEIIKIIDLLEAYQSESEKEAEIRK